MAENNTGTQSSTGTQNNTTPQNAPQNNPQTPPAIDYGKIQQMLDGTLAAKEDTALKAYFKQQGLSQQEVEQAISAFKEQKAANQPDVAGMQNQITETQNQLTAAQAAAQTAKVETAATMMAVSLGLDAKTIPYVLKMADLSQVVGQDGKINEETLKTALNTVLEADRVHTDRDRRQSGTASAADNRKPDSSASKTMEPFQQLRSVRFGHHTTERRYKTWH